MNGYLKRAICHEAGHVVVALNLGFHVENILVSQRRPSVRIDLDSRTAPESYIVLAGGIAGEKFVMPHAGYDELGAQDDQRKISERGGGPIEAYLPDALHFVRSNQMVFEDLRRQLTPLLLGFEAQYEESSELLSHEEIERIWRSSRNTL